MASVPQRLQNWARSSLHRPHRPMQGNRPRRNSPKDVSFTVHSERNHWVGRKHATDSAAGRGARAHAKRRREGTTTRREDGRSSHGMTYGHPPGQLAVSFGDLACWASQAGRRPLSWRVYWHGWNTGRSGSAFRGALSVVPAGRRAFLWFSIRRWIGRGGGSVVMEPFQGSCAVVGWLTQGSRRATTPGYLVEPLRGRAWGGAGLSYWTTSR